MARFASFPLPHLVVPHPLARQQQCVREFATGIHQCVFGPRPVVLCVDTNLVGQAVCQAFPYAIHLAIAAVPTQVRVHADQLNATMNPPVIAAHETGYAEVTLDLDQQPGTLRLQPWSRVE